MPTGTRITTPVPRSYISDERLNSIEDPLAREAFFRAKLVCDNLGRLPGNSATIAGLLYPANPPASKAMAAVISSWVGAGLVFHYQRGPFWYIEITDTGSTQRLVGHMTERSEFPAPPKQMIENWEREFAREWLPIGRKRDKSDTSSEQRKDEVHTSSKPSISGLGHGLGREELGREEQGQIAADAADPDCLTPFEDDDLDQFDLHDPRIQEVLDRAFGLLGFDRKTGFGKKTFPDFEKVVLLVRKIWTNELPKNRVDAVNFMTEVLDECEVRKIRYPEGWLKILSGLRDGPKR